MVIGRYAQYHVICSADLRTLFAKPLHTDSIRVDPKLPLLLVHFHALFTSAYADAFQIVASAIDFRLQSGPRD